MRNKAKAMRELQHARRHFRHAAELARKRPFRTFAIAENAAEHLRTRCNARDLLDLGFAIHGKQTHTTLESAGNIPLLLDRVAEGDAISRGTRREHHFDLADRSRVKARAELRQELKDFRCRIGLHRIEHTRIRQRAGKRIVIVADDINVDDKARTFVAAGPEEFTNAISHGSIPFSRGFPAWAMDTWVDTGSQAARWRRGKHSGSIPCRSGTGEVPSRR